MFASRTNWQLYPNRFTRALEEHRRSGKELFDLTASNPTDCELTYPEEQILAALADKRVLKYRPESKGLVEARETVAAYYSGRAGFHGAGGPVDLEHIVLGSGTSELYSHIFRLLCEAGDEILVPAPSYPLFEFLADLANVRLVHYPLIYDHGWQIDFASLQSVLSPRSRAVLVVHPNNPTGSFAKPHEAAELVKICAEREMAIVADEVFLDYASDRVRALLGARQNRVRALLGARQNRDPESTFAFEDAALTFTLSGISKIALLPQMKLAWTVVSGPQKIAQTAVERLEVIADTFLSPSAPIQHALPKFLALRFGLQEQLNRRILANLTVLDQTLCSFKAITRLDREGGWYAVLRVPVTGTDEDLAIALLERCSVLVHPGHFFNFSQDGYLIVSLITPESQFQEGIRRLCDFIVEK